MKKLVASISLFCFFLFGSAQSAEATPGLVVAGVVAVGALALTAGGVSYYKPTSTGALAVPDSLNFYANPVTGGIGRMLVAQWQGQSQYLQDEVKSKLVAAKISLDSLRSAVSANPSTYPLLNSALTIKGSYLPSEISALTTAPVAGMVLKASNDVYYTVGSLNGSVYDPEWYGASPPSVTCEWQSTKLMVRYNVRWAKNGTVWQYCGARQYYNVTASSSVAPSDSLRPAPDVVVAMGGSSISDPFRSELDTYIAGPDWSVNIVDSGTASDTDAFPFVAPVTAVPSVSGLGTTTTAAAQTRLVGASTALAGAQTALAAAEAAYNNDPSPENLAALNTAMASVTDAQTEKDAAQSAVNNATEAQEQKYPAPNPPPRKVLSWARWLQVFDSAEDLWVWGQMRDMAELLHGMIRDPVAPSFVYTDNHSNTITISLSSLDSIALFIRWFIGLISTIGVVMMVARWWRGN